MNANLARAGEEVVEIGSKGTFSDVILSGNIVYEVKKSAEAVLNAFSAIFDAKPRPKTITQQDWNDAVKGLDKVYNEVLGLGNIPTKLVVNQGQAVRLDQIFKDKLNELNIELIEMVAPFL